MPFRRVSTTKVCEVTADINARNGQRDVKPLLASAEAACKNWRRIAEYFAVTDDRPRLTNARCQLSRCQSQRDAFATELLMQESP